MEHLQRSIGSPNSGADQEILLSLFYTPGLGSPSDLSWVTQQKISIAPKHYQTRLCCFPGLKFLSYLSYVFLLLGLHKMKYFKTWLLCHFFEVTGFTITDFVHQLVQCPWRKPVHSFIWLQSYKKDVFIAEWNSIFRTFYFKAIYKRHFPSFFFIFNNELFPLMSFWHSPFWNLAIWNSLLMFS